VTPGAARLFNLPRHQRPQYPRYSPGPGTSIVRFEELDEGVYKGSKPKSDADYQFLRSKGIKHILNLRFFPFLSASERRKAKANGMILITGTIIASPAQPTKRHIDLILCMLRDKCLRPIYFHCDLGRDRASLIAALYKVYFRGMPQEEAWREAEQAGFKGGWTLRGLKEYYADHTRLPIARYVPVCPAVQEVASCDEAEDVQTPSCNGK